MAIKAEINTVTKVDRFPRLVALSNGSVLLASAKSADGKYEATVVVKGDGSYQVGHSDRWSGPTFPDFVGTVTLQND